MGRGRGERGAQDRKKAGRQTGRQAKFEGIGGLSYHYASMYVCMYVFMYVCR